MAEGWIVSVEVFTKGTDANREEYFVVMADPEQAVAAAIKKSGQPSALIVGELAPETIQDFCLENGAVYRIYTRPRFGDDPLTG